MQQRPLSRTGREVSAIGLGTWQLGADWGDVSEDDARAVLAASAEAGVLLFDTADVYGDGRSEQIIGAFMKSRDADDITVATKMGRREDQVPENYVMEHFRGWLDRSRRLLDTETLDLVQLHCPPSAVIDDDATWEALDQLVSEGVIAAYGASVETMDQALSALTRPNLTNLQIIFKPVPPQAPRRGASARGREERRRVRARAARERAAVGQVFAVHDLRRERPPLVQPQR
ncbi:aryl-alcohol dehydrogenase-like predicted oxidoreductase [Microbacterium sp. SORGH_AS 969]|nr:aryl-alcohol dehydrogenase-like predicted oxidoreductase [Microbacterium sp. SORGH_AS_0969]